MRIAMWLWLGAGCAGPGDTEPADTDGDSDTDADSDADADTDTDAPVLPCAGVVAILDLPGTTTGTLERTDTERWTGQGDLPTDLLAVELPAATPFEFTVTYPKVSTGTSEKYWMQAVFLDATCAIRIANASTGGDQTVDRVTWRFTPDAAGWWFPMLHFGEAMVTPGSVAYTAEISPL